LVAAQRVADRPQHNVGEPQALPNAGLQAEQYFHDDQGRQGPQVDLPRLGDAGFAAPPRLLVRFGRVLLGHAPALIVSVLQYPIAPSAVRVHAGTRHAGSGGWGRTRGSLRNCSSEIGMCLPRNCWACGSHMTASRTVGLHWQLGTAQRCAGTGAAGRFSVAPMSPTLMPMPVNLVKHRWQISGASL
jgi:hypothetical protein